MFRVLLCISCCSAPPPRDPAKRKSNSNRTLNGANSKNSNQDEGKKQQNENEENKIAKDQLLPNQIEAPANNEKQGNKSGDPQGKINLPDGETTTSCDETKHDGQLIERGSDSPQPQASIPTKLQQGLATNEQIQSLRDAGNETRSHQDDYESSLLSSIEIGPLLGGSTDSTAPMTAMRQSDDPQNAAPTMGATSSDQRTHGTYQSFERAAAAQGSSSGLIDDQSAADTDPPYDPLLGPAPVGKNVPSTTKIGDYARIEYSPLEDLESVTTMSYSRFGSDRGQSRTGSTKANTTDGDISRRSSQGGIESTSISIASQLSNEQFQQNLTNMLESVNSTYQTIGAIGLPLGPPMEGTLTETAKTSPETPGAALTSASQDSLSDVAFDDVSPQASRLGTLRSNASSTGAALVGDSLEKSNLVEELAEFAQPAPLAMAEDEDQASVVRSDSTLNTITTETRPGERVGSPQSIATTTSGGLTNPTPTPSEMSGGSGKNKRFKPKALLKKLRPGNKKKPKNDIN